MSKKGKRTVGRRKEDFTIRNLGSRYQKLYRIGQTITSRLNMESIFDLVMDQTNQIMQTERSTLFVCDDYTEELWSLVATGIEKKEPECLSAEKTCMDVSILFIDIQDFGRLLENHDARMVNDMVENHFSKYLMRVGAYGGEPNETSGGIT